MRLLNCVRLTPQTELNVNLALSILSIIFIAVLPYATLAWYFKRGKKTNTLIAIIMLSYIVSFIGAALIVLAMTYGHAIHFL